MVLDKDFFELQHIFKSQYDYCWWFVEVQQGEYFLIAFNCTSKCTTYGMNVLAFPSRTNNARPACQTSVRRSIPSFANNILAMLHRSIAIITKNALFNIAKTLL